MPLSITGAADLFVAGQGPYYHYRIPGLVVTPDGRVLAYGEARHGQGDWEPSDIVMRASDDGGLTWAPMQLLAAHADYGPSCMNNPVMIPDVIAGTVHALYCHDYRLAYSRTSQDGGRSFGPPREITETFAAFRGVYPWTVLAIGPGHGIQLRCGRLIVPIWLSADAERRHEPNRAGVITSDDHGKTWQAGALVPDTIPSCNEAEAAQLSDGRVLLNMRNLGPARRRAVTLSETGTGPWSEPVYDESLFEPRCFGSLLAAKTPDGRPALFFANPDSRERLEAAGRATASRADLTLRVSYDDGRTWPGRLLIDAGASGYADLAMAADGRLLCLYERGRISRAEGGVASLALVRLALSELEAEAGDGLAPGPAQGVA
ncbi:MAG: sialidase family protein [Anaerolineae bacterium]